MWSQFVGKTNIYEIVEPLKEDNNKEKPEEDN